MATLAMYYLLRHIAVVTRVSGHLQPHFEFDISAEPLPASYSGRVVLVVGVDSTIHVFRGHSQDAEDIMRKAQKPDRPLGTGIQKTALRDGKA